MAFKTLLSFLSIIVLWSPISEAKKRRKKMAPWKIKVEGEFSPQIRLYEKDRLDTTDDQYSDFYTRFVWKAKRYRDYFNLNIVARSVTGDSDSSQLYAKEAWWMLKNKKIDYLVGINYFNWSALELFHPINIINAIEVFEQDQIGEPMAMVKWKGFEKSATFYLLPYLTPNIYNTSEQSRLGFSVFGNSIFVQDDDELYEKRTATNYALEWKQSLDSLDYRLLYYSGPDRSMELFSFDGSKYNPIYFHTSAIGFNLQANWFSSLWKFEFLNKSFQHKYGSIEPQNHKVLGFGYEFSSVLDSGGELSYLLEIQTASGADAENLQAYYTFQKDLFLGIRYSLGDMDGTQYLLGYLKDMNREAESAFFVEYTTRINAKTQIELGSRFVWAKQKDTFPLGLERQDGDNYIYGKWVYYFR